MPDGFSEIITQLERQRSAIDNALAALRDMDGIAPQTEYAPATVKRRGRPPASRAEESSTPAPVAQSVPASRKGGMSPEGKARLVAALKARWAAKKAAEGASVKKSGAATNKVHNLNTVFVLKNSNVPIGASDNFAI